MGVWVGVLLGAGLALWIDLGLRGWGTRRLLEEMQAMAWDLEPFMGLKFNVSLAAGGKSLN